MITIVQSIFPVLLHIHEIMIFSILSLFSNHYKRVHILICNIFNYLKKLKEHRISEKYILAKQQPIFYLNNFIFGFWNFVIPECEFNAVYMILNLEEQKKHVVNNILRGNHFHKTRSFCYKKRYKCRTIIAWNIERTHSCTNYTPWRL